MGRFKKFFYVILSIIMIFINVTTIKATDFGDSFVTSFTLINEKNGEIVSDGSTIIRYQEYEAKFTFELPDGVVQPNDTLEVSLPEILQSRDFAPFNIHVDNDSSKDIVAKATIDSTTGKVKLTFQDYVKDHLDVKGEFKISALFLDTLFTSEQSIPLTYTVNGTQTTINVVTPPPNTYVYNPVDTNKEFGSKASWLVAPTATRPALIGWALKVNYQVYDDPISGEVNGVTFPKVFKDISVDDVFGQSQRFYEDNNLKFTVAIHKYMETPEGTIVEDKDAEIRIWDALNRKTELENYGISVELKADGTGFTANVADATGVLVEFIYYTELLPGNNGEILEAYDNTAIMEYNNIETFTTTTTRVVNTSSGGASGTLGAVVVVKVNEVTKDPLPNAVFDLYNESLMSSCFHGLHFLITEKY